MLARPRPISLYSDDDDSSFMSCDLYDSPDATTISSESYNSSIFPSDSLASFGNLKLSSDSLANKASLNNKGASSGSASNSIEFLALRRQLGKFTSKTGAAKCNLLRLSLLAFLRKRMLENDEPGPDIILRVGVFSAWWSKLLDELQNADSVHLQAESRSAYMEAISGLISRPEWKSAIPTYQSLLWNTLKFTIPRLGVASLPISLAAFAGKLLAYAFFYCNDIATVLLQLLCVNQSHVEKLASISVPRDMEPSYETIKQFFPSCVQDLVGVISVKRANSSSYGENFLKNGWHRHWIPSSALFCSFLNHYYIIMSGMLPSDSESWTHAHLGSPGLFLIQGAIVSFLDSIVRPSTNMQPARRPPAGVSEPAKPDDPANLPSIETMSIEQGGPFCPPNQVRIDSLRLFTSLREILHFNVGSSVYYRPFAMQFDRIFKVVAMLVSIHHINPVAKVCDMAEEWIVSAVLSHPGSQAHVLRSKDCAIDWEFWVSVGCRMLSSENSFNETRGMSLLFNMWKHLPKSEQPYPLDGGGDIDSKPKFLRSARGTLKNTFDSQRRGASLLYDLTDWLLGDAMWTKYFCHWNPLVRSYYHRLVCFCIASTGSKCRIFCDLASACYINKYRGILKVRLSETYIKCSALVMRSSQSPITVPSAATPGRWFLVNRTAPGLSGSDLDAKSVYSFDVFDSSVYYSRPITSFSQTSFGGMISPATPSRREPTGQSPKNSPSRDEKRRLSLKNSFGKLKKLLPDSPKSSEANVLQRQPSKRLNFLGLGGKLPFETIPARPVSPPPSTDTLSISAVRRSLSLKGTMPPKAELSPRHGIAKSGAVQSPPSSFRKVSSKRKMMLFAKPDAIPLPWQLEATHPEVSRPQFRFALVPQDRRYLDEGKIAVPFLPYEPEFNFGADDESRMRVLASLPEQSDDLSLWNYGCRSLFEWNQTVAMFEEFVNTQNRLVTNVENLELPLMASELLWKASY